MINRAALEWQWIAEHATLLAASAPSSDIHTERERRAYLEGARVAARTFQHELNSKLTITTAQLQLLLRRTDLADPLRDRVQSALDATRQATGVLQYVLTRTLDDPPALTQWTNQGSTIRIPRIDESLRREGAAEAIGCNQFVRMSPTAT